MDSEDSLFEFSFSLTTPLAQSNRADLKALLTRISSELMRVNQTNLPMITASLAEAEFHRDQARLALMRAIEARPTEDHSNAASSSSETQVPPNKLSEFLFIRFVPDAGAAEAE